MLTLLTLAAVLTVQTPPPPPHLRSDARVLIMADHDGPLGLDNDGDGQVTREEFTGPMNDAFARMDTDGNGRLSQEELSVRHGPDGSGGEFEMTFRPGPDGAEGGPGGHRMRLYRNGTDGGPGEHHQERVMVITGAGPDGHGEGHDVVVRRMGPEGGPMTWHEVGDGARIEIERSSGEDLDVDGDGRISEAEFSASLRAAFARIDTDHSGFLEAGEHAAGQGSEVFIHRIETRSGNEH